MTKPEEVLDIKRPDLHGTLHPVVSGNYLVDTKAIFDLQKSLQNWINDKVPGAIVYGDKRIGKTKAVRYLKKYFAAKEGIDAPIFSFIARSRSGGRPSENNFFSYLLRDLGHELHDNGTIVKKRSRVFNLLLCAGMESKHRQVILFIDDAQNFDIPEYGWLMDIFNELDYNDIKLTTILIGQDELKQKRNAMIVSNQKQIVGRFMIHQYPFYGIRDEENLAYLLNSYDEFIEFPENSGWSYTRYYFPVGFSMGNRLEFSVDEIMEVFREIHLKLNRHVEINIPMFYMTKIVNNLLKKYGADGEGFEWVNITHWRDVILESDYIAFIEVF